VREGFKCYCTEQTEYVHVQRTVIHS